MQQVTRVSELLRLETKRSRRRKQRAQMRAFRFHEQLFTKRVLPQTTTRRTKQKRRGNGHSCTNLLFSNAIFLKNDSAFSGTISVNVNSVIFHEREQSGRICPSHCDTILPVHFEFRLRNSWNSEIQF
jgi:hypothetical protein